MADTCLSDFNPGLNRLIQSVLSKAGIPGAAIAITIPGQSVVGTYGVIDVTREHTVGPDTAFDIGSCSKAFIATAIALLVSSNRLKLDDPVLSILPGFKLDEEQITESVTIRDLLCNRTGLRRQIPVTAYSNPEISAQEILQRVRHMDRQHEFRLSYAYFNPGFMACAQVIEKITGMPYSTFLDKEIFTTIGMRHSASGPGVIPKLPGRASGHTFVNGKAAALTGPVYHNLEGAAGVYSSAMIGVSVFLNAAKGVHQALSYTILETLLTGSSRDWAALATADLESMISQTRQHAVASFPCTPGAATSAPLEKLAGRYRHSACGEVHISVTDGGLKMRLVDGRLWDTRLTHIGDNVFECHLQRPEALDFMPCAWRARFEVRAAEVLWVEDLNARYERVQ